MFFLSGSLREKIFSKLNNHFSFCSINQLCFEDDCSCKGACGTYTPPCSCCAYN